MYGGSGFLLLSGTQIFYTTHTSDMLNITSLSFNTYSTRACWIRDDARDFKKPRRQRKRKRLLEYNFALLVLLRDYSNSFNLYSVAELSGNRTGGNGVQVETEKENINRRVFTLSTKLLIWSFQIVAWQSTAKEMYQNL